MKKILLFLVSFFLLNSCSLSSRRAEIASQMYTWKGRSVTKKTYDRKLKKHISNFVKNSSEEDLRLFYEMKIEYDTLPKNEKK